MIVICFYRWGSNQAGRQSSACYSCSLHMVLGRRDRHACLCPHRCSEDNVCDTGAWNCRERFIENLPLVSLTCLHVVSNKNPWQLAKYFSSVELLIGQWLHYLNSLPQLLNESRLCFAKQTCWTELLWYQKSRWKAPWSDGSRNKVYRTQVVIPTCIVSVSRTPVDELLTSEHSSPNSCSLDEQQ